MAWFGGNYLADSQGHRAHTDTGVGCVRQHGSRPDRELKNQTIVVGSEWIKLEEEVEQPTNTPPPLKRLARIHFSPASWINTRH